MSTEREWTEAIERQLAEFENPTAPHEPLLKGIAASLERKADALEAVMKRMPGPL